MSIFTQEEVDRARSKIDGRRRCDHVRCYYAQPILNVMAHPQPLCVCDDREHKEEFGWINGCPFRHSGQDEAWSEIVEDPTGSHN